jgi:hypothetical protein
MQKLDVTVDTCTMASERVARPRYRRQRIPDTTGPEAESGLLVCDVSARHAPEAHGRESTANQSEGYGRVGGGIVPPLAASGGTRPRLLTREAPSPVRAIRAPNPLTVSV